MLVGSPGAGTTPITAVSSPNQGRWSWRPWSGRGSEAMTDAAGIAFITGSLLIYGVLQERIMTIGFGPQLEIFEHSIFLVLCNRLVTCIVAFACVAITGSDVKPAAPLMSYCTVSFTNVVATSCQYEALKYVSFAVQTLAKSAKAFPVMLWGSAYAGKRYKPSEYLHAGAICFGCSVFVMGGSAASRVTGNVAAPAHMLLGAGLMLLYLAVDGLTSTYQDSMFSNYNMTIYDQVMYTTGFSTLLSFAGAVSAGQLLPAVLFILRNPDAMVVILALSASSAIVQLIIGYTIKRYGALVFATIMTTRQFCSILLSSLVFWTPLTPPQWVGLMIVFGATYWKLIRNVSSGRIGHRSSPLGKASPAPHVLLHPSPRMPILPQPSERVHLLSKAGHSEAPGLVVERV